LINCFQLLRNVGQFDSVAAGANLPLARLSVIYAENGRGKTTLAAILRSLATGDPIPVAERHRLAATHAPHIVIDCSGGPPDAVFENNQWNRTHPEITIFDDVFVTENVYSGLVVDAAHRQNLHELILGAEGVTLTEQLETLRQRIEAHNTELRRRGDAIPEAMRDGFNVDAFCALPERERISDEVIQAERALAAAQEQDQVRATAPFDTLDLPEIDVTALDDVLARDLPALDADAAARVEAHLAVIGNRAEEWVAEGMGRLADSRQAHDIDTCPFCAQGLDGSPIIEHYRTYFSDAYKAHTQEVAAARTEFQRRNSGEVFAGFERSVRFASERREFWSRYADIPEVGLDTAAIVRSWRDAVNAVTASLDAKHAAPLDQLALPEPAREAIAEYERQRQLVAEQSNALQEANKAVALVKEQTAAADARTLAADLARLRAIRARHADEARALCDPYLAEKEAKGATETERVQVRTDLDTYRASAFPGYEAAINLYLERFNAGFRLGRVTPTDTRGGPGCTYSVIINNTHVPVTGAPETPGNPSFRNTLSAGDRNTLALAFFFASLDRDPNLGDKIVVVDDPLSSLDEHRSLTTVQEVRNLAERAEQVIVLSHTKAFLCRVWESSDRSARASMQVSRDGDGSTLAAWDVDADSETEHDRRHTLLSSFMQTSTGDPRAVAEAIRPHIEAFLRVACPEHFPASTLLGPFRTLCDQRAGTPQEILSQADTDELENLIEYANRFHHDTNPAWETEVVNDAELRGFVGRTLSFVKR
jgi:wobble nucleotide-excising tRNase